MEDTNSTDTGTVAVLGSDVGTLDTTNTTGIVSITGNPDSSDTTIGAVTSIDGDAVTGTVSITDNTVTAPHPAVSSLMRLREKLNSLGSFVVTETEALIAEIENHLKH